mmetsp:Transcript_92513/g.205578  ORF Transcript_92513/g.205578 Transcript_92513/m.205578 type:complete len:460 (-) Transcript_92513:46-1425(-)
MLLPAQAPPAQALPPALAPLPPTQAASEPEQAPQAPPTQAQPQADTSVNIAILESKDFPSDVAPVEELFSEFAMADGRPLFECPSLLKLRGIDLMNCPLDVLLKLRVRRRMPAGPLVLWHVVLPLPIISKYLLQPPHEWETWIGLFPNTQSLEAHAPEMMFTQSVHLISRPEFPKLRLRFTYHNQELQAQLSAQLEMQQQESKRREELTQQAGRQAFEEIHKLTRTFRDSAITEREGAGNNGGEGAAKFVAEHPLPGGAAACAGVQSAVDLPSTPTYRSRSAAETAAQVAATKSAADPSSPKASQEKLREALLGALGFISSVHQLLAHTSQSHGHGATPLPQPLDSAEVLASATPETMVTQHCERLHRCLYVAQAQAAAAASGSSAESNEKQIQKLLAQQGHAMQLSFEGETSALRQQLQEARRIAQEREGEVCQLRAQLAELTRQRVGGGAHLPNLMD